MAEILKGENRYCLQKNDQYEWHLFPASKMLDGKCNLLNSENSICKKEKFNRSYTNPHNCLTEYDSRKKCLEIGRGVCGTCISHLYKTLSDEEKERMK